MPNTTTARIAAFAAALAPATLALAAEGGDQNPLAFKLVPYISTLIVFGVVFFILQAKVWPIILKALGDREQKIRSEIEQAEQSRRQAEEALAQYQQALAEARVEAGKIIEEGKIAQQKVAADLKARTETELNSMRDAAKRDIEAARRQAVGEIYEHMATVATSIAGRILEREINVDDQRRLVDESLNKLQSVSSN
jgi:F-type H+-transporting ATPase subunit b